MKSTKKVKSLDEFVNENIGFRGSANREQFEKGYENFRIGFMIQNARLKLGLTQEELALRCGTNKGNISKIERDLKEIRLSTLQKIVELGLGGRIELKIKL